MYKKINTIGPNVMQSTTPKETYNQPQCKEVYHSKRNIQCNEVYRSYSNIQSAPMQRSLPLLKKHTISPKANQSTTAMVTYNQPQSNEVYPSYSNILYKPH